MHCYGLVLSVNLKVLSTNKAYALKHAPCKSYTWQDNVWSTSWRLEKFQTWKGNAHVWRTLLLSLELSR
jgi:hypothetical protein